MRRGLGGQAVVEMAIVMPVMLFLVFGFLGLLVWLETAHDLGAATALAGTTAATFREDTGDATTAERETFFGTMRQYGYVDVQAFQCRHDGTRVSCFARAVLRFDRTPLALAWPGNPTLDATSVSYASPYRSR